MEIEPPRLSHPSPAPLPSLARQLVVKRAEADAEGLERGHGVLVVHREGVLSGLRPWGWDGGTWCGGSGAMEARGFRVGNDACAVA